MLKEKKLSLLYWAEVVATAVYILNPSTMKVLKFKTPVEALTEDKSQVDHIRVFGCLAYVYIDS